MSLSTSSPILPTALADAFHAFGSTTDREEAVESTFRWVDSALGSPAISVRLLVLNRVGHLRQIGERTGLDDVGRKRSARRREAILSKRPCVIRLRRPHGASLAIVPLVCRGEVLGIMEVAAPAGVIDGHIDTLDVVGGQAAIVLRNVALIEEGRRVVDAAGGLARLMRDLLAVSSREQAVRAVVRFCWEFLGTPVVGWLETAGGFGLVASRGVGREMKHALARPGVEPGDQDALVRVGNDVLGEVAPIVTSAGDAVVLVVEPPEGIDGLFQTVAAALSLSLDSLSQRSAARDVAGSIDAGLAWTAHELRTPLLGVEKVIDRIATHERVDDLDRRLLERARVDIHRLAITVDDLLRWAVGVRSIRRRRADLVPLIRSIVRSVWAEETGRRIVVNLPSTAMVRIDPLLVRVAFENLVRNSLQHGSDDVEVTLDLADDEATVSVSDRGPGIPPSDAAAIFEPFMRGHHAAGGGRGLGLFIATRVAQAHGGALWLESGTEGPVFRLRIPVEAA